MDKETFEIIGMIVFLVGRFVSYILSQISEKTQKEEIEKFVKQNNTTLEIENKDYYNQFNEYNFNLFKENELKTSYNIIKIPNDNYDITYFEYHGKKSSGNKKQSVLLIKIDFNLPEIFLTPNKKHTKKFTFLTFENHPIFSKKYILECVNENDVKKIFFSNLINYFEQNNNLTLETNKNLILVYYDFVIMAEKLNFFIDSSLYLTKLFKENIVS